MSVEKENKTVGEIPPIDLKLINFVIVVLTKVSRFLGAPPWEAGQVGMIKVQ
jgi:hypothetical protein